MNTIAYAFVLRAVMLVVGATPGAPFNRYNTSPQRQIYNSRFLRLESAPSGPYPAAGYRPQGEQFRLPSESFTQRRQQQQQFGQPDAVYGPPEVVTEEVTTETDVTTTEIPTTTEYIPRNVNSKKDDVKVENVSGNSKQDPQEFQQEGIYYIYHPDGLLQRVVYATKSEDMGYTARLTYKDVEPIKEPIYTYNPQTLEFSQIQL